MSKTTVWLLILFFGTSFGFIFAANGLNPVDRTLLAQVGVVVGVPENPYNALNDQLNQKQDQLNQEASALAAQEAALANASPANGGDAPLVPYLGTAVGVLTFLVVLNFYLDWRRWRNLPAIPMMPEEPHASSQDHRPTAIPVSDDVEAPIAE